MPARIFWIAATSVSRSCVYDPTNVVARGRVPAGGGMMRVGAVALTVPPSVAAGIVHRIQFPQLERVVDVI